MAGVRLVDGRAELPPSGDGLLNGPTFAVKDLIDVEEPGHRRGQSALA